MTFKELLKQKNVTGYALSKMTGIPYTTINDLINGRTIIQNISLKHAVLISECLNIGIEKLVKLDSITFIEFRYFRGNILHDLKRTDQLSFIKQTIKSKTIDFYYKNGAKEFAYYLLALIDYLCRINEIEIYKNRYNDIRKEKLKKPLFIDGDIMSFETIEEAEKKLEIKVIPEFRKFNIVEESVTNVA